MQCGQGRFFRAAFAERAQAYPAYSSPFLRVAYRDLDDRNMAQAAGCGPAQENQVAAVYASNALPLGATVNATVVPGSGLGAPDPLDARGYVDVYWTPKCEDRSQVPRDGGGGGGSEGMLLQTRAPRRENVAVCCGEGAGRQRRGPKAARHWKHPLREGGPVFAAADAGSPRS